MLSFKLFFLGCIDFNFICSTEVDCEQGFFLTNCPKSCGICEDTEEPMIPEPNCTILVPQITTVFAVMSLYDEFIAPPDNPIQA